MELKVPNYSIKLKNGMIFEERLKNLIDFLQ